jgi:glutaredoxin
MPARATSTPGAGDSTMTTNAIFYHAGCPVCVTAEQKLVAAIDRTKHRITVVHLGEDKSKLAAAKAAGVLSVPALVIEDQVFHLNMGAPLSALG